MFFTLFRGFGIVLLVLCATSLIHARQPDTTEKVISVSIPSYLQMFYGEQIFEDFEANNPGVSVVIVNATPFSYEFINSDPEQILEALEFISEYTVQADINYVDTRSLTIEITRAGNYLNLQPLVDSDPELNPDAFYSNVWDSFKWDNMLWAIPFSASPIMLVYNLNAFDSVGLTYPTAQWTLTDLSNAAQLLATYDANGDVVTPGLFAYDPAWLFPSLMGYGYNNESIIPNEPQLNNEELEELIEVWTQMREAGTAGVLSLSRNDEVPMFIGQTNLLRENTSSLEGTWQASVLPGGRAGLYTEGYAISSATQQPELAYELIKYLLQRQEAYRHIFAGLPALREINSASNDNADFGFISNISPENLIVIGDAINSGIPAGEIQFYSYLSPLIKHDQRSAEVTDLSTVQIIALEAQDVIASFPSIQQSVNEPTLSPMYTDDRTSLTFYLQVNSLPFPLLDQWNDFITTFVAMDEEIENVNVVVDLSAPSSNENVDCYQLQYNNLPNMDVSTILNLDPLLFDDPSFDEDDLLPGLMAQIQRDNRIWAYPISVRPSVLQLNLDLLQQLGVSLPTEVTNIEQLITFLDSIAQNSSNDESSLSFQDLNLRHILLLAAGYGGTPINYSTRPSTVRLTDDANLRAVLQVLDLFRNGTIDYHSLVQSTSHSLNFTVLQGVDLPTFSTDDTSFFLYPSTTSIIPLSYSVSTAYISSNSLVPEACYRFIREISQHPELFGDMPAFSSVLESSRTVDTRSLPILQIYDDFANALTQPQTLNIPRTINLSQFIENLWVSRAIDNYVLENHSLEHEFSEAQTYIENYRVCLDGMATTEVVLECAITIDPSLQALLNFG